MSVISSHIWYILGTLVLGIVIGWQTYPIYKRFISRMLAKKEHPRHPEL